MYGKAVREFRESKGWSQSKLAELTGVPRTHIVRIERDERLTKEPSIVKLLRAGLRLEDLPEG